jgi:hypothetical protein
MFDNLITDITIALELNCYRITRPEYFVPVSAKIPGSELELAQRRGRQRRYVNQMLRPDGAETRVAP